MLARLARSVLGFALLSTPAIAQSDPAADTLSFDELEWRETPGALGDPLRLPTLLPGMSSILSGVPYTAFRGTEPATTGYFLDGVRVALPFHLLVGPGLVMPETVGSLDVHRSAPIEYGSLLGGAVELQSAPWREGWHGAASLDELLAGVFAQSPTLPTGTRASLALRFDLIPFAAVTVMNGLQKPPPAGLTNPTTSADVFDYQARVEQPIGPVALRLLAFGGFDLAGTSGIDSLTAQVAQMTHRADLRGRTSLAGGQLEAGVTWGLDRLTGLAGGSTAKLGYGLVERSWAARASWATQLADVVSLKLGATVDHRQSDEQQSATVRIGDATDPSRPTQTTAETVPLATATIWSAFAEAQWLASSGWRVAPAIRIDDYHSVPGNDAVVLGPRLDVSRPFSSDVTGHAHVALVHQPATTLVELPSSDATGLRYGLQEAAQVSAGARWRPLEATEVSLDGYFDPLIRTVELELLQTDFLQTDPRQLLQRRLSSGSAWGLELMARRHLGGAWYGWVSYSFQQSSRTLTFPRYDLSGNVVSTATASVPYALNQQHVIHAVASWEPGAGWRVGAGIHLNTGIPEEGIIASQTQQAGTVGGIPDWVPVDMDRDARVPAFFRVDLRVSKRWQLRTFALEAFLEVMNATLAKEVIGYSYSQSFASIPDRNAGRVTLTKSPIGVPPITVPLLGVKGAY